MHIIAGQFKRKQLKSPEGSESRPTLSRIRESLFNIIMPFFPGADFLDLYAGAGSIGIEAASRGGNRVVMVEQDRSVFKVLEENVRTIQAQHTGIHCRRNDAWLEARQLIEKKQTFDIVFLDPPYAQTELDRWSTTIRLDQLLKPSGQLILQHGKQMVLAESWAGCQKIKTRFYGKTGLSFFSVIKQNQEEGERP